ncbi:hypothetical protein [Candidatus Xianfuyuplasma coldseepsis]|uniref:Uncharacterized protein n=1 Tax=Candidatus Xianfuyuplasma coldseepsis TaxID=2782163 RepID=A0A7L7KNG3_9MOLU|nr:hypothetical protein [Xianfuyuplasma coldseepsis]QMS84261.1 hypothetical protein G4Z02_00400 [Xianfuyuplasma coldseepsis]
MRRVITLVLLSFIILVISACGLGTEINKPDLCGSIDLEENQECFDEIVYNPHYEGLDFVIYKLDVLPTVGTDDIVDMGEYDGKSYYFSSGTHYQFYKAVKEGVTIDLLQAIMDGWFTLEDIVNDFNIEELQSQEIVNIECDNPRETYYEGVCQIVVDEELLFKVQEIKNAMLGETSELSIISSPVLLGNSSLYGRIYSAPRVELLSAIKPFDNDAEWIHIQAKHYELLEEIVLNGYQSGNYENPMDFITNAEDLVQWFNFEGSQELNLIIDTQEETLFSRIIEYSDIELTDAVHVETVYTELNSENEIYLERYLQNLKVDSVDAEVFYENYGLFTFGYESNDIAFNKYQGSLLDANTSVLFTENYNLYSYRIRFFNDQEQVYLEGTINDLNGPKKNVVSRFNELTLQSSLTNSDIAEMLTLSYYASKYYLGDNAEIITGTTLRLDTTKLDSLFSVIPDIKYHISRLNSTPSSQKNALEHLNNVEINGEFFDLINDNNELDLTNFKYQYLIASRNAQEDYDRYKERLQNYEETGNFTYLRDLLTSIYDLRYAINQDPTLVNVVTDDTLEYSILQPELTIEYIYYTDNAGPNDIENVASIIMNELNVRYDYIINNENTIFNLNFMGQPIYFMDSGEFLLLIESRLYVD